MEASTKAFDKVLKSINSSTRFVHLESCKELIKGFEKLFYKNKDFENQNETLYIAIILKYKDLLKTSLL